jgi:hypothetical protein
MMINLDFKSIHVCVHGALEVGGIYGNSQLKKMFGNIIVMMV